ncbi:hypothetical protein MRX96_002450 [Rhipicephalus microplus]
MGRCSNVAHEPCRSPQWLSVTVEALLEPFFSASLFHLRLLLFLQHASASAFYREMAEKRDRSEPPVQMAAIIRRSRARL